MKKLFHCFTIVTAMILTNSCAKPMEACFTYSPAAITANTEVTFNSSCSENVSTYIWKFGDNTLDTTTHSATVTHTYSTAGIYTVTLDVERKDGATFKKGHPSIKQTITVN